MRRRVAWVALVSLLAFLVVVPGAAAADSGAGAVKPGTGKPSTGKLTPRLSALTSPAVRSLTRQAQARRLSLPAEGPGSLMRHGSRVVVDVRASDVSEATLAALRDAGASITHVSPQYRVVTAEVPPTSLQAVAALPQVVSVTEELEPMIGGAGAASPGSVSASSGSCTPAATSEGDIQLRADLARSTFGVDGSGVSVGILSNSFDADASAPTHAADDVASGDLPGPGNPCGYTTPVNVVQEISDPTYATDEGRGMAQIVHDLAPGADISFATADEGLYEFADNIRALRTAGARVIVDDVFYYAEPFFQDGPVAVAINDVTANGALYFSAAGNSNHTLGGNPISGWEAPAFRPVSCPAVVSAYATKCMDFNPGAGVDNKFNITLEPSGYFLLDLQWNEPWYGVSTDMDLYVLDASNNIVAWSNDYNVTQTQVPFEFLGLQNTGSVAAEYRIVIGRYSGTGTPRLKFVLPRSSGISAFDYPVSSGGDIVGPDIGDHQVASMMSVGAVPYDDSSNPESYSSMGPNKHYWRPVKGSTPAAKLSTPEVLSKPDIAATDGGANTFFGDHIGGVWRFYGTSAAAPHAAAVAALMLDRFPSAPNTFVKDELESTARAVGTAGSDVVGSGLIDAYAAVDESTCTITGTAGNDTLVGTSGDDVICGLGGNDILKGLGGNDVLAGWDGNDTLYPGAGSDTVDGGSGTDTVNYSDLSSGVTVNLSSGSTGRAAGADTLTSIENATGTSHADTLSGNASANALSGLGGNDILKGLGGKDVLTGSSGNDTLYPGAGNDTVNGGSGTDTVDYSDLTSWVTVNLSSRSTGRAAGTDHLTSIENAAGTNRADTLTGNASANFLKGLGGNDSLSGGAGKDRLDGGPGRDSLNGGPGIDTCRHGEVLTSCEA